MISVAMILPLLTCILTSSLFSYPPHLQYALCSSNPAAATGSAPRCPPLLQQPPASTENLPLPHNDSNTQMYPPARQPETDKNAAAAAVVDDDAADDRDRVNDGGWITSEQISTTIVGVLDTRGMPHSDQNYKVEEYIEIVRRGGKEVKKRGSGRRGLKDRRRSSEGGRTRARRPPRGGRRRRRRRRRRRGGGGGHSRVLLLRHTTPASSLTSSAHDYPKKLDAASRAVRGDAVFHTDYSSPHTHPPHHN